MSTWTNIQTIGFAPEDFVTADLANKKIAYGTQNAGYDIDDVYEYDIGTDTQTLILDRSNHANWNVHGIGYFDGELYALIIYSNTGALVYRYSGTPDSWTLVDTLCSGLAAHAVDFGRLWVTPSGIVAYAVIDTYYEPLLTDIIRYSTDGSTWSDGNVGAFKAYADATAAGTVVNNSPHCYKNVYHRFSTDNVGPNYSIVEIDPTTGVLTELTATDTDGYHVSWPESGYDYHWVMGKGEWTEDDWASTENDGDGSYAQQWSAGFEFTVSIYETDWDLYQWSPTGESWSLLDETSLNHTYTGGSIFRMNDGYCYLVMYDSDVSQHVVAERTDPISPPSSLALFYHGLGILVEKFEFPFSGVLPRAMTLDKSLGTVVAGADQPSTEMVAYSQYPYAASSAITDAIPTGVAITSVKWI